MNFKRPAALGLTFSLLGCGSSAVRPDGLSATDGLGQSIQCTPKLLASALSPFVVEWPDGERAALESEMAKGVALVKFSCEGASVLRGCALPGVEYAYRGINKKTKVLQMNDAAAVQANFSSFTLGGAAQAALTQGKSLNLAYVMAGTQGHTVQVVNRGQIKAPHCAAATHFVIDAQLGAFTLASGERGQLVVAAQVFGLGDAGADVSSQKHVASTDGDPASCGSAKRGDSEPADGCAALLQVGLVPISGDEVVATPQVAAAADPRTCPEGFLFQEDGCVRATEAPNFLCKAGDFQECGQQCKKGNDGSCGRLAAIPFDYDAWTAYEDGDVRVHLVFNAIDGAAAEPLSAKEGQLLARYAPFLDRMKAACETGEGDACALAALLIALQAGDDGPLDATTLSATLPLVETACGEGQYTACRTIVDIYGEGALDDAGRFGGQAVKKSPGRLEQIAGRACDAGNAGACFQLGRFFYDPGQAFQGEGATQPDPDRAATYFFRACMGGDLQSCAYAAAASLGGVDASRCGAALAAGLKSDEMGIELFLPTDGNNPKQQQDFCGRMSSIREPSRAFYAADKACYLKKTPGSEALCAFGKTLQP